MWEKRIKYTRYVSSRKESTEQIGMGVVGRKTEHKRGEKELCGEAQSVRGWRGCGVDDSSPGSLGWRISWSGDVRGEKEGSTYFHR